MAVGSSKLRWSREGAASTSTEKQDAPSDNMKLMEFAFRMGQSSQPAAGNSSARAPEPSAPAFPPLQSGVPASSVPQVQMPNNFGILELFSFVGFFGQGISVVSDPGGGSRGQDG